MKNDNARSLSLSTMIDTTKVNTILGVTILFLYFLMVMGTFVTSTGSGLACPDWPLCYGSVTPPLKLSIWFEWGHRLLGGITGLLIVTSTLLVWRRYRGIPRLLTGIVVGLLLTAVFIGGVTVLIEAPYLDSLIRIAIVSSHLIIATLVLISLLFILRRIAEERHVGERGYHFLLFCAVYFQVILGILVRYSKASLACPDFPLCQGKVIPSFSNYAVALHFSHRILALTVVLLTTILLVRAIQKRSGVETSFITFTLVLLQALFGILIVLTGMFLPLIIMHGATGFLLLGWLAYQAAPFLLRNIVWKGGAL
ncbi:MAG: heme A synthase [Nitrospirae bacterium]|nr:heme A synthase [Nitrospirota bacterium]